MARKQYGLGVIGTGCIWRIDYGHWPGLRKMADRVQVRYVYDTDIGLASQAAAETGAKAVRNVEEMFAAPDVDIIAILTPPAARVEYVRRTCEAGKHLMLEKPMARTIEQALEIVSAIRSSGAKCFMPFLRALNAKWRQVVEIVRSGELGEPIGFIPHRVGPPYEWVPLDHWMHDQTRSGGPIFDYSIHFLEFCRACMAAEAREVFYGAAVTSGRVRSDDQTAMMVYFDSGACGEFTMSWNLPPGVDLRDEQGYVICRKGVITLRPELRIHVGKETREVRAARSALDGREGSYLNLIAAIEEGAALYADEVTGLRMTEILEAALRSRESGRRERVKRHEV